METKTELLPCPCCGGKAEMDIEYIGHLKLVWYSKEEGVLIEKWNTRVYPAEVQAAIERDIPVQPKLITATREDFDDTFECLSCAKRFSSFDEFDFCPWCGQRLDWNNLD